MAIIVRTDVFTLTSQGNGVFYTLYNRHEELDIFFQGEDATQFRDEWEGFEKAHPEWPTHKIMCELWEMYSTIAQPSIRAGDM